MVTKFDHVTTIEAVQNNRRFRWAPVLAGVAAAISLQIVFTVLGTAIGAAATDPMSDKNPIAGLSYGAMYWWIFTGLFALAVGGFISGKTAESTFECDGRSNGLVAWSTINILGLICVLLSAGGALSGAGKILGGTASVVAGGLSNSSSAVSEQIKKFMPEGVNGVDTGPARSQLEVLLKGNTRSDATLTDAFDKVFSKQGSDADPAAKDALANVIASRSNVSHDDAMADINKWQAQYNDAKSKFESVKSDAEQKAKVAADKAAKATAEGALIAFLTLVAGAFTATLAGMYGVRYRMNQSK